MNQVAEVLAAERIVAKVLNDRAAIGVGMGVFDLVFSQIWKALQQEGVNLGSPYQVYDFLVRENGVAKQALAR